MGVFNNLVICDGDHHSNSIKNHRISYTTFKSHRKMNRLIHS